MRQFVLGVAGACGFVFPASCGFDAPEGIALVVWLPLIELMSPGAKQVTRPLEATRKADGQAPLVRAAPAAPPCAWTVKSLPSELPATPTLIPGISYEI